MRMAKEIELKVKAEVFHHNKVIRYLGVKLFWLICKVFSMKISLEGDSIMRYYCPVCGLPSDRMEILNIRYRPNSREEIRFPGIAGEWLQCPCGRIWRWADLRGKV